MSSTPLRSSSSSSAIPFARGKSRLAPTSLRQPWIYFVMSLFTSFAFSIGIYLAAQERQLRWNARAA